MNQKKQSQIRRSLLFGIALGLIYGLALRISVAEKAGLAAFLNVMSVAFLLCGPFCIGVITTRNQELSSPVSFTLPMIPVILGCGISYFFHMEGLICIIMYLPAGLILAGLGGLLGLYLRRRGKTKLQMGFLFLPFVIGPIEQLVPSNEVFHTVKSEILVKASKDDIWGKIKSVSMIAKHELRDSWVHKMGFPRPLEAEIDQESVGGIRQAKFEGQLTFHETVTSWVPGEELAFDIKVNPEEIPPTTLDQHVTIGGPFFDVLHGRYLIGESDDSGTKLYLESRFRLSTHFNWYAGLWTSLIMNQIQQDILTVIQKRAEKSASLVQ